MAMKMRRNEGGRCSEPVWEEGGGVGQIVQAEEGYCKMAVAELVDPCTPYPSALTAGTVPGVQWRRALGPAIS